MDKALDIKRSDLLVMLDRIKYLPAHNSLYLLKIVFAIPKLVFIMRTSPCFTLVERTQLIGGQRRHGR